MAVDSGENMGVVKALGLAVAILTLLLTIAATHIRTRDQIYDHLSEEYVPREVARATYATKVELNLKMEEINRNLSAIREDQREIKALLEGNK